MLDYWKFAQYKGWPLTIVAWQRVAETSTDIKCWRWQARTIFWFMGCPCDKNFASGRILGSGRLQPRTKLSGCSTCRILSHLCICNICWSHPLCSKWAAAPWHTGAKSKSKSKSKIGVTNYLGTLQERGHSGYTTSESDRLDEIQWAQGHISEPACVFETAFETFWFRHHSHNCIWPYDPSFDFESTSETKRPVCVWRWCHGGTA